MDYEMLKRISDNNDYIERSDSMYSSNNSNENR